MAGLGTDDVVNAALAGAPNTFKDGAHMPHVYKDEKPVDGGHISVGSPHDDPDDPHYGDEFPTEEETRSLRRVPDHIPWATYLIAYIECAERFSYYGCTVVFTNFIQQPLPQGSRTGAGFSKQSGALGMGQRASTGLTTFNQFWVYVIPLFGAYVADKWWGRYKTICVAVGIATIGHILLIISAVPKVLENTQGALACFVIAMIIMGLGTGAFKSNVSPLVAEQYRKTRQFVRTDKKGERVLVDPALTSARIYMVSGCCGSRILMIHC